MYDNQEENTPLHNAADEGNNEAVLSLIQKKAKVNAQNKYGSTPLHFASKSGHNDVVNSLCLAQADVHAKRWDMRTPLHNAAINGHLDVVSTLIQYGADVNALNKFGKSVLHYAAEAGNIEVVLLLMNKGADIDYKDSNKTALDVASDNVKKYFSAIKDKEFPREILALGPEAIIQFLKAREKGSYRSNIIRCMVVGHFGVGKTTLVRKLMNTSGNVKSTNGIEVHIGKCYYDAKTKNWLTQEKHTELILGIENISQIHFWDFGGQLIFYTTHQSYLSRRGLYLLVFDLSMGLRGEVQDEDLDPISRNRKKVIGNDYLEFWIGSIRLYGRSKIDSFPKILLIGTHKDIVKDVENLQSILDEIKDKFASIISSGQLIVSYDLFLNARDISDDRLAYLKDIILSKGQSYPEYGENIPESWMKIHEKLQMLKERGEKVIPLDKLIKILSDIDIHIDSDELHVCLLFFHAIGYCVFFKDIALEHNVILDAGWIIDAMKCIITHETFIDKIWKPSQMKYMKEIGIMRKTHILDIWNRSRKDIFKNSNHLLRVMERLDLISIPKVYDRNGQDFNADYYCVPALLKSEIPQRIRSDFESQDAIIVTFQYEEVLPLAIYNRLVASCLHLWEVYDKHIYNGLVIFRSGQFHLIKIQKEFLKVVLTISTVPHAKEAVLNKNLCRAIIQFVEQSLTGVMGTYVINTKDPSRNFSIDFNHFAKENNLDSNVEETKQYQTCPSDCRGPTEDFRNTTLDDRLLMRIARKCKAEYLLPLSANFVGNVQFYEDKRDEFRELSPKDWAFFIFYEWKCISLRHHKEISIETFVQSLNDADVDIHIVCQALQNKEVDDSFLSPIVRQMEVYDEFIDAVADQMSATYFQIGIELGMSLGEIKQLRVSHQCSAPRIVREMLRLWLKRNGSNKETLIGSLASALLHAQENIAVLMDLEGKAVIQHLCKKELRRQSSQECSIS